MRLTVWHNSTARFDPYADGHHLLEVASHWLDEQVAGPNPSPLVVADWAYHVLNADLDLLARGRTTPAGETAFLVAVHYRARALRSLSIGDVACIQLHDAEHWLACERFGWRAITPPVNRTPPPQRTVNALHTLAASLATHHHHPTLDGDPDGPGLLSDPARAMLTEGEFTQVWGAFSHLQHCAWLVGIPHAEWWQLHHRPGLVWPWQVIDLAAPIDDRMGDTALTLRTKGPSEAADTDGPTTPGHYVAVTALCQELHARAEMLRGMWELAQRGYSYDLMAASHRPHPTSQHPQ